MGKNKSPYDLSEGCKGWAALAKAHRKQMKRKWGALAEKH